MRCIWGNGGEYGRFGGYLLEIGMRMRETKRGLAGKVLETGGGSVSFGSYIVGVVFFLFEVEGC